jgi:hypothetical protein
MQCKGTAGPATMLRIDCGDTESTDILATAGNLDVAFVSPWLYRSMIRRNARIDAKRVVIYHHRSAERVAECTEGCVQPGQGDTIRLD